MPDKALISNLTYRSLESQREALSGIPFFILPDETNQLFRPTNRKATDRLHVVSLAIIAKDERTFRDFLSKAKERKCEIVSKEDGRTFKLNGNTETLVKWWKDARRSGSAKIGGRISADKKKATTKEAVAKIEGRWPLSSKEWPTNVLLAEAGISLNTAKAHLGKRPIAQYNYQAAQKRKERRNARAN